MIKINEKVFRNVVANLIIVLTVALVGIASFNFNSIIPISGGYNKVIYRGNDKNKNISLMINVYWGNEETLAMLDIFKKNDIKCTFFIGGSWADDNIDILKKMNAEGHEIASHGYFHKDHKKMSLEQNKTEMLNTEKLIEGAIGIKPTLFAPPSGSFGENTVKAANEMGYKVIMWSRDTVDWRDKDVNIIYNKAITGHKNGDLILMHPMKETVEAMQKIIDFYKTNGYNLVTVSKNIE